MLTLAVQHGIVVFLTAAETIDSLGLFRFNGGEVPGVRTVSRKPLRTFDNIVWDYGNDFQTW